MNKNQWASIICIPAAGGDPSPGPRLDCTVRKQNWPFPCQLLFWDCNGKRWQEKGNLNKIYVKSSERIQAKGLEKKGKKWDSGESKEGMGYRRAGRGTCLLPRAGWHDRIMGLYKKTAQERAAVDRWHKQGCVGASFAAVFIRTKNSPMSTKHIK